MKRILLTYNYFYPAYKAGGPVQSCTNLVRSLGTCYDFLIFTRNSDLDQDELEGVIPNQWINFENKGRVFYHDRSWLSLRNFKELLQSVSPSMIYINGIYNLDTVIIPLLCLRFIPEGIPILIAPRGMFQKGALSIKPLKKRLFLVFFKLFLPRNKVFWHATDEQEGRDIMHMMGKKSKVHMAPNIPSIVQENLTPIRKEKGKLRIIVISLITKKKNLHLTLEALRNIEGSVTFDIYGPIKDVSYWKDCQEIIADIQNGDIKITYKGSLKHEDVQKTLSSYHFFILPTKGENFGHAIFESFSVFRPVIISDYTPWYNLIDQSAGFNVTIENAADLHRAIKKALEMNQIQFDEFCEGAGKLAQNFFDENNFIKLYQDIFNQICE